MTRWIIHIEKSRSWWDGTSTTYCGLTITKVKISGPSWLLSVTCPACKTIEETEKASRNGRRGGWW